jgi:hypothetical protein
MAPLGPVRWTATCRFAPVAGGCSSSTGKASLSSDLDGLLERCVAAGHAFEPLLDETFPIWPELVV